MRTAVNVIAAYAGWFAVAFAAAGGHAHLAALASVAVIGLHLVIHGDARRELPLALAALAIGLVVENIFLSAGVVTYAAPWPTASLAPLWIVLLWPAFATLVNVSLGWLKPRLVLASVLGAVAAPLSYWAGARLGALTLAEPLTLSLAIIAALWAVAFPLLLRIARALD